MSFYQDKAWKRARALAKRPAAVTRMAARAGHRLVTTASHLESGALSQFSTLVRIAKAWGRGEYRQLPLASVIAIVGTLVYFVMPLDAIPDPILGLGFIDDIAVMRYAWGHIKKDIDSFLLWEGSSKVRDGR